MMSQKSKKILRTKMAIVIAVMFLANIITLAACDAHDKTKDFYGTIDGKTFVNVEVVMDVVEKKDDFTPIDVPLDVELQEFIYYLSYCYKIDYAFVIALIEQESDFDIHAISRTGDVGLMQINRINHKWLSEELGITDFEDPYQNAQAGLYILRLLFEKYDDPTKVLMAYNIGEYGAQLLWNEGVTKTAYSESILSREQELLRSFFK
jgi:hypothetical protein